MTASKTDETSLNTDAFGGAVSTVRHDFAAAEARVRQALAALSAELCSVDADAEKARLEAVIERLRARVLNLEDALTRREEVVAAAAARLDAVIEDLERWQQSAASPSS